jgi:hypothetical protein
MVTPIDVLTSYLEGGRDYLNALGVWGRSLGYEVRRKKGIVTVWNGDHLVAAASPPVRERLLGVPRRIVGGPCPTCGAAPTSTYHDGSPKYDCGPHRAFKFGPDGERIELP